MSFTRSALAVVGVIPKRWDKSRTVNISSRFFCKKREELGLTWVEAAAMEELGGLLLLILFVLKVGAQIAECLL